MRGNSWGAFCRCFELKAVSSRAGVFSQLTNTTTARLQTGFLDLSLSRALSRSRSLARSLPLFLARRAPPRTTPPKIPR